MSIVWDEKKEPSLQSLTDFGLVEAPEARLDHIQERTLRQFFDLGNAMALLEIAMKVFLLPQSQSQQHFFLASMELKESLPLDLVDNSNQPKVFVGMVLLNVLWMTLSMPSSRPMTMLHMNCSKTVMDC